MDELGRPAPATRRAIARATRHALAATAIVALAIVALAAAGRAQLAAPPVVAPPPAAPPTFHESIEPLLERHCQECHHDGGSGPFALTSYADAAAWSAQIREVVTTRRMPPWHADPAVGLRFANDRSLPDATIAQLAAWVDGGAREGDPAQAPPARAWPSGWSLGEPPDLVVTTPPFRVPAEGTLPYEYVHLATRLDHDAWVRAAELKSTHAEVVHHALVFLDEPQRSAADAVALAARRPWRPPFDTRELMQGAKPNELPLWMERFQSMIRRDLRYGDAGGLNGYFLSGLAGGGAAQFADGDGKWLAAGTGLVLQLHYQPNGKAVESSTSVALWFAKEPCKRALDTRGVATVVFAIPPGAAAHEVTAEYRLPAAATLLSLQPHMHRRGKDFTYVARYPDGREETLLSVPRYDFNWQHEYRLAEPKRLPEETVLRVVAHFDNSAENPANPDPTRTVHFGLQTDEEMVIGYFEVVWDAPQ